MAVLQQRYVNFGFVQQQELSKAASTWPTGFVSARLI